MCSVTTCSFEKHVYLHPPSPTTIISGNTFLSFVIFYASLACVVQLAVTLQVMLMFFLTDPSFFFFTLLKAGEAYFFKKNVRIIFNKC